MCCIFTCCGWMIDLVQRVWTFSMSCIIMSAVGGVMVTSSMSGIALGYNYSLAEYIDLKETNVSVYLKRGVFDDEIADDMDWRRAGHLPVQGQLKDDNLRTGAPEDDYSTTLRSGRRLDDSVFEANDHNNYEGSLMRLTAKPPPFQDTPRPAPTDDVEMANALTTFSFQALDQMKAFQSLMDSRRAMATGGSTISPLATYEAAESIFPYLPKDNNNPGPLLPYLPTNNNPNLPMHPEVQYRRMMAPGLGSQHITMSPLNPARLAVPDPAMLESPVNWLGPKQPGIFVYSKLPEFFIKSPTYPPPVTVAPATVRPTGGFEPEGRRHSGSVAFPYPFTPQRTSLAPPSTTEIAGRDEMEKQPDFYNEKTLIEGNELSKNDIMNRKQKWGNKSPEEEYEDEIKGLPVRKRRSINTPAREETNRNIIHPVVKESPKSISSSISSLVKNIFATFIRTTSIEKDSNNENNTSTVKNQSVVEKINESHTGVKVSDETKATHFINDKRKSDPSVVEEINDSKIGVKVFDESNAKKHIDINDNHEADPVSQVTNISDQDSEKKPRTSLLDHLVTSIRTKEAILTAETTPKADVDASTSKRIKIKTVRRSFESKIVSSKYVTNNLARRLEKKQPFSNQEILNSISVGLNEAGLLRNPSSSPLVKLLQATLTA